MMYMHMAFTLTNQELGQRTDSHKMLTPTWRRVRSGPLPRTLLPWTARWVRRWTPRSPPTPQALQIYASQIQAEAGGHVDLPIYLSIQVFIHLSLSLSLSGPRWEVLASAAGAEAEEEEGDGGLIPSQTCQNRHVRPRILSKWLNSGFCLRPSVSWKLQSCEVLTLASLRVALLHFASPPPPPRSTSHVWISSLQD